MFGVWRRPGQSVVHLRRGRPNLSDRSRYLCRMNAKPSQPYSPCELGAQVESGGYNNERDSYCLNHGLQRTQSPASRRVSAAGRRSEGFGSFRQGSRGQKSPRRLRAEDQAEQGDVATRRAPVGPAFTQDHDHLGREREAIGCHLARHGGRDRPEYDKRAPRDQFQGVRHSYARVLPARRTAFRRDQARRAAVIHVARPRAEAGAGAGRSRIRRHA